MSQSRFSIVLVGVSALLRRPLVSRLRPADGERSSWVVFAARGCRFDSGFRSAIGLRAHCFGVAAGRVGLRAHCFRFSARTVSEIAAGRVDSSAFRFGNCPRRVGLRAHCFRFSARTDPHRRTADARTDGAQRHDNCFTSKHLSQHVNLPHRTP